MVKVDGIEYKIPVVKLRRKAPFLDKFAERTEDGILHRELIGVYFNYELQFGRTLDMVEYGRLWEALTKPVESQTVIVPYQGGMYTFNAYFSNITDEMWFRKQEINYFENLTANFVAMAPART